MAILPITLAYQPRKADRLQDAVSKNLILEQTGVRKRPGLSAPLDGGTAGQGLYFNNLDLFLVIDDALYTLNSQYSNFTVFPAPDPTDSIAFVKDGFYYWLWTDGSTVWTVYRTTNPATGFTLYGTVSDADLPTGFSTPSGRFVILGSFVYYISNKTYNSDIYRSSDVLTWTHIATAPYAARLFPGFVVYNDKLWVLGGRDAGTNPLNDVWSSSDGVTWIQVTTSAAWSPAEKIAAVAHNGLLFVILPATSGERPVWKTTNGSVWENLINTNAIPFLGDAAYPFSLRSSIWLYGPGTSYRSVDGADWIPFNTPGLLINSLGAIGNVLNLNIWLNYREFGSAAKVASSNTLLFIGNLSTPTVPGQMFELSSISSTVSSAGLVIKSLKDLYYYNGTTLVKVS